MSCSRCGRSSPNPYCYVCEPWGHCENCGDAASEEELDDNWRKCNKCVEELSDETQCLTCEIIYDKCDMEDTHTCKECHEKLDGEEGD